MRTRRPTAAPGVANYAVSAADLMHFYRAVAAPAGPNFAPSFGPRPAWTPSLGQPPVSPVTASPLAAGVRAQIQWLQMAGIHRAARQRFALQQAQVAALHRLLLQLTALRLMIGWRPQPAASGASGAKRPATGGAAPGPTAASTASTAASTATTAAGAGLSGRRVLVLGDSLMVGAQGALRSRLQAAGAHVEVDAASGRRLDAQGPGHHLSPQEIAARARASGANIVVLELGTNPGAYERLVPETMAALAGLRPAPRVVWVDTQARSSGKGSYGSDYFAGNARTNEAIARTAARYPNMTVAKWSAVAGHGSLHAGDGLHLSAAGNSALVDVIARTLGG